MRYEVCCEELCILAVMEIRRFTTCGMVVRCGGAARPLYPYRLAAADDDCCAPGAWPPPAAPHLTRPLTRTPSKEDLTHTSYLNSG
ncbi:hypothetical protein EVAR_39013_1 [Eumeta japonica]|uniref:Uncharacterized protein n=1 Tax=Eumeta variegata TaxID=151549 RepID=A0A4C1WPR6_EUMVA|nr:hypothetical protein EVAR_39013_1 [Eumeta japonica]